MAGLFWATIAAAESAEPDSKSALSDQITNAVSATFAYKTPEEREAQRKADAESYIDKPKNDIIRLPRVVVEGSRPPVFREQDIYSPKALTEIAIKRYLSDFGRALNAWRIPIIGGAVDGYAMGLWAQDERKRQMREISEQIQLDMLTGNTKRAAELREILRGNFVRPINEMNPGQVPMRDARGK